MHSWGDENVDWEGIDDAAQYIASGLVTWARIPVLQYKEKFGTVRVYCGFGNGNIYSLWRPSHCWVPKWWPSRLDNWLSNSWLFQRLIDLIMPLQKRYYAWRYKKAVQKWPHLREEIVSNADYGELFEGVIDGYKHSDYWRTM